MGRMGVGGQCIIDPSALPSLSYYQHVPTAMTTRYSDRFFLSNKMLWLSLFETEVLDESILVLGMGGQFIPLRGVEEATLKVGRLAF